MVHLGVPGFSSISIYTSPVNLSDVPTNASTQGGCPKDVGIKDKAKILGHFSDALDEMAQCISDLEDGYFLAFREVIHETKKALHDISHIDSYYVSRAVTVMASWQEAVQAAASHMETTDTAIYFMSHGGLSLLEMYSGGEWPATWCHPATLGTPGARVT